MILPLRKIIKKKQRFLCFAHENNLYRFVVLGFELAPLSGDKLLRAANEMFSMGVNCLFSASKLEA